MINIKELEKRWLRYKTKGLFLILLIVFIMIALIYGGYYILYRLDINRLNNSKKINVVTNNSVIKKESDKNIIEVPIKIKKKDSKDVFLSPYIPIIDLDEKNMKDEHKSKSSRVRTKYIAKSRKKENKKLIQAKKSTYLTPQELEVIKKDERVKKRIEFKTSSSNYMAIMKKKFEQSHNPREAILIAQAYYNAGNYKRAEEWALKANELNKNLDESWILFAKAKNMQGRKKEALKILIAYYKKSNSSRVKDIIYKLKGE